MPEAESRYYDGRDSTVRRVDVRLSDTHIEIRDDVGALVRTWPIRRVRLIDEIEPGAPLRVTSATQPDARLTVADPDVSAALVSRLASASGRASHRVRLRLGLTAALAVALAAGAYLSYPLLVGSIVELIPLSIEEQVGASASAQFLQIIDHPACANRKGAQALQALTGWLAVGTESPVAFKVAVADVDAVNAIALPGGYIFLFKGLLEEARTADEVAGVLAHEMAHVVKRHPTQTLVRSQGLALLMRFISGGTVASIGETLISFSYSRGVEAEADDVAVAILETAGVSADGLARFFDRLAEKEKSLPKFVTYLSTHPRSEERARSSTRRSVAAMPLPANLLAELRSICER